MSAKSDTKPKLWHFYHAYAPEGKEDIWLPIVTEHANALCLSGLSLSLSKTYVGVIGSESSAKKISAIFNEYGIKHEICDIQNEGWEQVTLNKLYEFSIGNEGYVFYAHTKGAFYATANRHTWRRIMTKYLIGRWSEHVLAISKGFCASGIFFFPSHPELDNSYIHEPVPLALTYDIHASTKYHRGFFAGNFWWCNLGIIKNMGYPSQNSRMDAEAWPNRLKDAVPDGGYMLYDMIPGKWYDWYWMMEP